MFLVIAALLDLILIQINIIKTYWNRTITINLYKNILKMDK